MEMNRRGFFGLMAAPILARLLSHSRVIVADAPLEFTQTTTARLELSMAEFSKRYIRPTALLMANHLDAMAIADYRQVFRNGRLNLFQRRFDPARLPA